MKRYILASLILTSILFAESNIIIGGDNSFNNNKGNLNVTLSEIIKKEQIEIDEVLGMEMKKSSLLSTLIRKAKKINNIKTTRQDKKRRCRDEVSAMFSIFGHEINFGYKKCEEWF